MIDPVTKYMEQIAKATRKTPLDVAQRDIVATMYYPRSATRIFDIPTFGKAR